ncbi:MAG TPA: C45 family peptidase [Acidobacteriota bacterium]|jgi:hypothetical protein
MKRHILLLLFLLSVFSLGLILPGTDADPRLQGAYRHNAPNGWIYTHLEGKPADIGFQHGYLLAPEIDDARKVVALELTYDSKKEWEFFRDAAKNILWPRIEQEYRDELNGIVEGLKARGVPLDIWDVVATNAWLELPYYLDFLKQEKKGPEGPATPKAERCSAFVATGSYTRDGRVVMGHNAWTRYMDGQRWNIIFDIRPTQGRHILMDGFPGLIHSADDFGVNSAGIMITETTITQFQGWDSGGIPEFVRARKAMQYATSIDDFKTIMVEGNNGGYANNWLVADRKTNEIADLELGLKNVNLSRTRDGYFVGSNFPVSEKLAREETGFDLKDGSLSANARRIRWEQLMKENRGKIDVAAGQRFLSDHFDTFAKRKEPTERTLCGHIDLSPRGSGSWQPPYGPAGAAQNKVTSSVLAERMSLVAVAGHACGIHFKAKDHLQAHPEFAWQKEFLRDMNSQRWTTFTAGQFR